MINNDNDDDKINKEINFEPTIITNSYYDNYSNKNVFQNNYDKNKQTEYINYTNNPSYLTNNNNKQKMYQCIKKLYYILNIEGNFIKIFGLDKIIVPFLILTKNWLTCKFPELNKYVFREKLSSLTINYTHFTSTYYNQQNSSSDCIVYRSILAYVYKKKPHGCKFSTNPNGNFMFFEPFDEVKINKCIWIISRVTTTNTNCLYTIEIISYNSSIEKINKFIRYCLDKFKNEIQKDNLIKTTIKYYKYLGMNNSSHQTMYDEYNFIQTKTFKNIFFTEKDCLVKKIKYFSENEDCYRDLGIPWCMGILLHGKPGTGKTSCIKAIASLTQRHIIDVSLSKIKTLKELSDIFYNTKINSMDIPFNKRLFVLEELDLIICKIKDRKLKNSNIDNMSNPTYNHDSKNTNNTFKNHTQGINYSTYNNQNNNKNIEPSHNPNNPNNPNNNYFENDCEGVSLEHLLTIMDGTVEHCGSMFIATTNYLDQIDKALTRPGRFDVCLYLDNANSDIIIQMIQHFASKYNKHNSKSKSKSDSNSTTNKNIKRKLTSTHYELISKYSTFEEKNIWSPAKISQICLTHIDSDDYYGNIILSLEKDYEEQCKLL